MSSYLGHASTMAGLGPSEPKNLSKMSWISLRNGFKFGSNGFHVQLGLELLRAASTQRVRRNVHRPTRPSSCNDAQLMLVALFCCLHAELCCLLAAAE